MAVLKDLDTTARLAGIQGAFFIRLHLSVEPAAEEELMLSIAVPSVNKAVVAVRRAEVQAGIPRPIPAMTARMERFPARAAAARAE